MSICPRPYVHAHIHGHGHGEMMQGVKQVHQRKRTGFLINLDFYHVYDRVCLSYVDRVLEAMAFGPEFREVVPTLHSGATASFLLPKVTRGRSGRGTP
jgi:hypothetical protein